MKNGQGMEILANGTKFQGTFVDDIKSGYGEIRYKSGLMYKGQYLNNMKHGKGVLLAADSSEGTNVQYH